MDEQQLHDKIAQYLLGELSATEKARFEAEIASNPQLAEQVAFQRIAFMGLDRLAGAELRQKFDAWDDEPDEPDNPPPPAPSYWKFAAIGLILLLASGIFWYFSQVRPALQAKAAERAEISRRDSLIQALEAEAARKQMQLNQLLEQNTGVDTSAQSEIRQLRRELEQMENTLREQGKNKGQRPMAYAAPPAPTFGTRGDTDGDLKAAVAAFDKGRYAEAERILKNIAPDDAAAQRSVVKYLPYALFYNGKFGEAAEAFVRLKAADRFEAKTAEWYLALSYANDGRKAHARAVVAEIVKNDQHPFYAEALALEKRLGK